MKSFEYLSPDTREEALSLLRTLGEKSKIIAGGTDLLVDMEEGREAPDYVINILGLEGLKSIREEAGVTHIGPLTTFDDLEKDSHIQNRVRVLFQAAWSMGSPQIRNRATLGGNVGKTSVAGDGLSALMALNASVELTSLDGVREITLDELTQGPGDNSMAPQEMITDIFFTTPTETTATSFYKLARRRALGISDIGAAMCVTVDGSHVCRKAAIRGGALARYPLRFAEAEDFLLGRELNWENLEATFPMLMDKVCDSLRERPWEIPYKKGSVAGVFKNVYQDVLEQFEEAGR
ncbi:FAD binding domain-containing protein [Desulfospira joergensenii]|uniref:FAD binding domain-containing protein n=1 Tax=Desulfospira joergensenii TaxID=53329 RepID=UPI0003B73A1F|nr:FAD binding domain-containing protein [Desulfospira joergensenii]